MRSPVSQIQTIRQIGLSRWLNAEHADSILQARAQVAFRAVRAFSLNTSAVTGALIILLLLLSALFAPLIAPYDPVANDLRAALQPPSRGHLFGTDELGRDIFSRIVWGSRITAQIVVLVTLIAGPIGLVLGIVSGYAGGLVDRILMRVTDVFLSFPSLVLALAFAAALGPSLTNAVIAIALTIWPPIARLARAEALTVRGAEYISAARMSGAGPARIVLRHILPVCLPSVVVRLTLNMAAIILTAAGLGFLGLGAQPPLPEWGAMTSSGRKYIIDSWWVVTMPGSAILIVSLAFNLVGDGLRDLIDPRHS